MGSITDILLDMPKLQAPIRTVEKKCRCTLPEQYPKYNPINSYFWSVNTAFSDWLSSSIPLSISRQAEKKANENRWETK